MRITIEFEQEEDGRWIAEIPALPGVMVYGATKEEAESKVEDLAREVVKRHKMSSLILLERLA